MTDLTLYGLKNCDTCKKALRALEAAGKHVAFVDIRAETDLDTKVPIWLEQAGAEALVNRRSTTWRGLDEATRKGEPKGLLIANPTLIKRPVIEAGTDLTLGWSKDIQAKFA